MEEWWLWFETYAHAFVDKLDSLGVKDEADFVALLVRMDQYIYLGDLLYDEEKQGAEIAAYGLIAFDRMVRADISTISHPDLFAMHAELMECYGYVTKNEASSLFALKGANKRHAENRAMKNQVSEWLNTNMTGFKSMDSAAEAIAGKIVPIKFRTARAWVAEWKKLRPTGTP